MGRWGSAGCLSPPAPALVSEAARAQGTESSPSPLRGPVSQPCSHLLFRMQRKGQCVVLVLTAESIVGPWVIETQGEAGLVNSKAHRDQGGDINSHS